MRGEGGDDKIYEQFHHIAGCPLPRALVPVPLTKGAVSPGELSPVRLPTDCPSLENEPGNPAALPGLTGGQQE